MVRIRHSLEKLLAGKTRLMRLHFLVECLQRLIVKHLKTYMGLHQVFIVNNFKKLEI